MAITTYAELQSSVGDWLNRSDLTSVIKDFIVVAESEFRRTIRHRKMITRSDATFDREYSATPPDWYQTVSLILKTDPVRPLEYVTNEAMHDLKNTSSATGKPRYYTHVGDEIQVFPVPDGDGYSGELVYYAKLPALSDSATSNWLLDLAPDIYLYGTLKQSAPYLRDDERTGMWVQLYQKGIDDLVISDQRTRGQTSVRMKARALQ